MRCLYDSDRSFIWNLYGQMTSCIDMNGRLHANDVPRGAPTDPLLKEVVADLVLVSMGFLLIVLAIVFSIQALAQ